MTVFTANTIRRVLHIIRWQHTFNAMQFDYHFRGKTVNLAIGFHADTANDYNNDEIEKIELHFDAHKMRTHKMRVPIQENSIREKANMRIFLTGL